MYSILLILYFCEVLQNVGICVFFLLFPSLVPHKKCRVYTPRPRFLQRSRLNIFHVFSAPDSNHHPLSIVIPFDFCVFTRPFIHAGCHSLTIQFIYVPYIIMYMHTRVTPPHGFRYRQLRWPVYLLLRFISRYNVLRLLLFFIYCYCCCFFSRSLVGKTKKYALYIPVDIVIRAVRFRNLTIQVVCVSLEYYEVVVC